MTAKLKAVLFGSAAALALLVGVLWQSAWLNDLEMEARQLVDEQSLLQRTIASADLPPATGQAPTPILLVESSSLGQAEATMQDDLRALADAYNIDIDYMKSVPLRPLAASGEGNGEVSRLSIRLVGRASSTSLLSLLRDIERSEPATLLEDLYVRRMGGSRVSNPLEVQFTMTRFWPQSAGATP